MKYLDGKEIEKSERILAAQEFESIRAEFVRQRSEKENQPNAEQIEGANGNNQLQAANQEDGNEVDEKEK